MRTKQQTAGPAGSSSFQWADATGVVWDVTAEWTVIGGRMECSSLAMDSHGHGRVTSTVVRQVEAKVRQWRGANAERVRKLATVKGMPEVARRAARQAPAFDMERAPTPAPGRPRDDKAWHARAVAIRTAYEQGKPMMDALRELDPQASRDTLRKQIDRTRAWDREHGPGILKGVGRAKKQKDEQ